MLYAVLKPPMQERRMSMLRRVFGKRKESRRDCLWRPTQLLLLIAMMTPEKKANY